MKQIPDDDVMANESVKMVQRLSACGWLGFPFDQKMMAGVFVCNLFLISFYFQRLDPVMHPSRD